MDTICANSTHPGGAICVIRVSGYNAISITNHIFRSAQKKDLTLMAGYTVHFGEIIDENGTVVDDALVIVYHSPRSYTGEDSTEIMCHGSSYIVQRIIELLMNLGCRMARPGEFTDGPQSGRSCCRLDSSIECSFSSTGYESDARWIQQGVRASTQSAA